MFPDDSTVADDNGIRFERGGIELLPRVAPLWHALRNHHRRTCTDFGEEMAARTWEQRLHGWRDFAARDALLVDLAIAGPNDDAAIGYCVSTIHETNTGEIDSLFVIESFRRRGVGGELVRRAIAWLDERGVKGKIVGVAAGNDEAVAFYAHFGFALRRMVLKQRPPSRDRG